MPSRISAGNEAPQRQSEYAAPLFSTSAAQQKHDNTIGFDKRHGAISDDSDSMAHQVTPASGSRAMPKTAVCPTDDDSMVTTPRDGKAQLQQRQPLQQKAKGRMKTDRQSPEYMVKSGIAGGLAGCAAKTVVGPLDRVKILFQASNPQFQKYAGSWSGVVRAIVDINRTDGIRGLYRGHSATLLRIFPYAGIKFFAYEQIRALVIHGPQHETPVRRFLSGSLAGSVSVFFTYPLEVIRVRLAFETKRTGTQRSGLVSICRKIYNERPPRVANPPHVHLGKGAIAHAAESSFDVASSAVQHVTPRVGLANFFRGFTATLTGMLPYAGSSFLTHDYVGDLLRFPRLAPYTTIPRSASTTQDVVTGESKTKKPAQLTAWAELSAGGIAGFVSQTASYPLEVIRRRMQVGGVVGDGHRLGMVEVARRIFAESGWRGFFVGLGIGYVKVVPMAATSFFVYERVKWWMGI
ncbi:mitochondrial carrier domain-containing protein [Lineolata rhizophorae]|uniref:Mitochondrial thiamine pyrophosphate carrier 1 n=1 Tax=Lineolata rhizophorae TaxID=578093 RepID=A0A6A6PB62_9PEZI|nr:mitochondrial carrier domain-containing protein [Lineolata rhizophorae]